MFRVNLAFAIVRALGFSFFFLFLRNSGFFQSPSLLVWRLALTASIAVFRPPPLASVSFAWVAVLFGPGIDDVNRRGTCDDIITISEDVMHDII